MDGIKLGKPGEPDPTITIDGKGPSREEIEAALEVFLDMWLADHDIEVGEDPLFFPKKSGVVTKGMEVVVPGGLIFGAYILSKDHITGPDGVHRSEYSLEVRQSFRRR